MWLQMQQRKEKHFSLLLSCYLSVIYLSNVPVNRMIVYRLNWYGVDILCNNKLFYCSGHNSSHSQMISEQHQFIGK